MTGSDFVYPADLSETVRQVSMGRRTFGRQLAPPIRSMTDPKPQADKFRDMAQPLDADEDGTRLEEVVCHVTAAPVPLKLESKS